jgi:hypothetical protein
MTKKDHILAAMIVQFNNWEELLSRLKEEQIAAPNLPSDNYLI